MTVDTSVPTEKDRDLSTAGKCCSQPGQKPPVSVSQLMQHQRQGRFCTADQRLTVNVVKNKQVFMSQERDPGPGLLALHSVESISRLYPSDSFVHSLTHVYLMIIVYTYDIS